MKKLVNTLELNGFISASETVDSQWKDQAAAEEEGLDLGPYE